MNKQAFYQLPDRAPGWAFTPSCTQPNFPGQRTVPFWFPHTFHCVKFATACLALKKRSYSSVVPVCYSLTIGRVGFLPFCADGEISEQYRRPDSLHLDGTVAHVSKFTFPPPALLAHLLRGARPRGPMFLRTPIPAGWPSWHRCGAFLSSSAGPEQGGCAPKLGFLGATPLQTFQAHPPGIRPPARGQHPAAPFLLQGNSHPPVLPGEAQRLGWSPRQGRQRSLDEKQMQPRKRLQALESLGAQWADLTPITWCLSPLPCPCLVLCFQGQILVLRTHPHAPPLNGERRQLRPVWLNPSSQKAELGSCFKRQPCCYYKNRGGKNESITINPLQKP